MPWFSHTGTAQRHASGMVQSNEHKRWDIFSGDLLSAVQLQARNPACPPPYLLAHDFHPAEGTALVKYILQHTLFHSEKKNKNRSPPSPSSHGKNNRLPSSNEHLLKAVSYMQNSHTKFTRYRIWPKSLFRFMFFFLNMPLEVRPALTVTHLKKEALKHLSFLEFGFISQLCAQAPLLAKQMAQQLLLIKYLRASPNDVNFPNSGIHSNRPAIRLQLRWSKEFLS